MITGRTARTTLRWQLAFTAVVAILATAGVWLGLWRTASTQADQSAEQVSAQIADGVLGSLHRYDLARLAATDRVAIRAQVEPYLRSNVVRRVKVWTIQKTFMEITFSDEAALEGERHAIVGEPAVATARPVPHDREHRFESAEAGALREVYVAFRDSLGNASLLEVYVPVSVSRSTWSSATVVLPLTLVGLFLLALLLIPIGVVRAGQLDRGRGEQRAALAYGLAAAELTRRELARDLHDDVLPRLASARLLLDAARHGPAGGTDLVGRAHQLIAHDVERIRALLAGLTTAEPFADDLPATFAALAAQSDHIWVDVDPAVRVDRATAEALHRIATELVRNAIRHADAERIDLRLTSAGPDQVGLVVADDGRGFDPRQRPGEGHIGLLLVRRAAEDFGGSLTLSSAAGAGTVATAVLPRRARE